MESQPLSPQESLNLITEVITAAKQRQEESGAIYLYWGLIIAAVSGAHFVFQLNGQYEWIPFPYLLIPIAAILSYFLFPYFRKTKVKNQIGSIINGMWAFSGFNMMVMGFALAAELGNHLTPFILILLGISLGISGLASDNRVLLIAGIIANIAGMAGFWIPLDYLPLLMAGVSLGCVMVPGIILNSAYRKRKHV
ncbi:MAG: hypothetical protein AAFY71_26335 [Bacteroidota bacterium]